MPILYSLCWALGCCLLLVTFVPLWRSDAWWVRCWDFPRLQIALLLALLSLAAGVFWYHHYTGAQCLLAVGLICLCYQLHWVYPYTPLHRKEVPAVETEADEAATITLLSSNVLTSNRRADALLRLVERYRPDILITLESDRWWQERLDQLEGDYPYSLKCPLDNLYGMHLYSRLPLEDAHIEYLVEDKVPSMHALLRLPGGDSVRLHCLHPAPPSPTENAESAERDAELVMVGRALAGRTEPVIVAGDLNDVAWSSTTRLFRRVSGLLDPRIGRGMYNTFHAAWPFLRWPLDHVFHSGHFRLVELRRLESMGSDHFPLLARLALQATPSRGQQSAPPADQDDRQRVDAKLDKVDVSSSDVPGPDPA